jgi:hypothetical protein
MARWEYQFVWTEHAGGDWRPTEVNGQRQENWKKGPRISDYATVLGEQGWELVGISPSAHDGGATGSIQYVFKRMRP